MKFGFQIAFGILVGLVVGYLAFNSPSYHSPSDHWEQVNLIVWNGSAELTPEDKSAGLRNTTRKLDFHLHRLEEMSEIRGIDVVLPQVNFTREVHEYIENYDLGSSGVVWLSLNPEYVDFPFREDMPLHLDLWFKKGAEERIRRFLQDVHDAFSGEEPEPLFDR